MTPENFGRVIRAMRLGQDENRAEEILVHWMNLNRCNGENVYREHLLDAGGAFFSVYSNRAMESGKPGAYQQMLDSWIDMAIGYDRGIKGPEFSDLAFEMYRVLVTHRL
jgi:hypothetical protein